MSELLPVNATDLERAIVVATDVQALVPSVDAIANLKAHPHDALIPWLIWEYGLGELLPYLSDPRRAINEGVLWQRSRGTPAALITALGWVGLSTQIEQEVPGVHFAQFQIDAGEVPDQATLTALMGIAQLSAPVRSRLARVFNQGWDLRRVMLDDSRLGDALLSDYSGVMHADGVTKLSFGRVRQLAQPTLALNAQQNRQADRISFIRLIDKVILDFSRLGDDKDIPNHKIIHSHLFTKANQDPLRHPSGLLPQRQFCKAMIVLGDSWTLGDTNACTPRRRLIETGKQLQLSVGDPLSATAHNLSYVEVLTRLDATHQATPLPSLWVVAVSERHAVHSVRTRYQSELKTSEMRLGFDQPTRDHHARHSEHHRSNQPITQSVTLEKPRCFVKAQPVLSDGVALGDVNSRTLKMGWFRTKPVPTLGSFALGDGAEIEWRHINDCATNTTQLTTPAIFKPATPLVSREQTNSQFTDVDLDLISHVSKDTINSLTVSYLGQTWAGVKWADVSWSELREIVGLNHISS